MVASPTSPVTDDRGPSKRQKPDDSTATTVSNTPTNNNIGSAAATEGDAYLQQQQQRYGPPPPHPYQQPPPPNYGMWTPGTGPPPPPYPTGGGPPPPGWGRQQAPLYRSGEREWSNNGMYSSSSRQPNAGNRKNEEDEKQHRPYWQPQSQWQGQSPYGPPPPGWRGHPPPPPHHGPPPRHHHHQHLHHAHGPPPPPQHHASAPPMNGWPGSSSSHAPSTLSPQRSRTRDMISSNYHPESMDAYLTRTIGGGDDDGGGSSADGGSTKEKGRGSYKCGRCGVPKKGHVCPYQPKLKRRPDEPPPETRNAAIQVEMDEFMTLRRLNIKIQGLPESYATEPYLGDNMVVGEPHPIPGLSALPDAGMMLGVASTGEPLTEAYHNPSKESPLPPLSTSLSLPTTLLEGQEKQAHEAASSSPSSVDAKLVDRGEEEKKDVSETMEANPEVTSKDAI